jgi:peptidoglycan/xylan/chitin deacetylase (PgdA/CDA1 family)
MESGWSAGTVDTDKFREGTGALRLTRATQINASLSGSFDLSDCELFRFSLYPYAPHATVNTLRLQVFTDVSNYYNAVCGGGSGQRLDMGVAETGGWSIIGVPRTAFTVTGSPSWSQITSIRFQLNPATDQTPDITIDELRGGPYVPQGGVAFMFDDANVTAATEWWPYLHTNNLPGTIYVYSDGVGADGMVSEAQIISAAGEGCCIANHGKTHTSFTTLTAEQVATEIETCRTYLDSLDMTGGLHVAYPFGTSNATVWGVLGSLGYRTGRGGPSAYTNHLPMAWPPYALYYRSLGNTTSLATAKGYIDTAVATGSIVMLVCHLLVAGAPADANQWNIDDFHELVDYVVANSTPAYNIEQAYRLHRWWRP